MITIFLKNTLPIPQYTIKEANDLIHERKSGVYTYTAVLHDVT
jgi:hypothetical protein